MDFKGAEVTEVRTGRTGTVIFSDLNHVSVQYNDIRKINCTWSQVKFRDEKNRLSLEQALDKKKRTIELKVSSMVEQNRGVANENSASQGYLYVVASIITAVFFLFVFSAFTKAPNPITNKAQYHTMAFVSTQEIEERINSIIKTAEHCSRARVYYFMTGKDMKRGRAACDDYYDWEKNFFPRYSITSDIYKNDKVKSKLRYIRMLEAAD